MMISAVGRKIYYLISDGSVLCDTGERQGNVVTTTFDQDFMAYPQLQGVDPSTVGVIQMAYGERSDEFSNMANMSVDLTTNTLIITPQATTTDSTTATTSA